MKRIALLFLVLAVVLPAAAATYPLGVGLYGGYDMPLLQQDVGSGAMWSIGVRGNIWSFFHGQLLVRGTSQGDVEEELEFGNSTETLTYKGGTLTGFGLNILLAGKNPANIWPYGLVGLSSNSLGFGDDFKEDDSLLGWAFGGGLSINLYNRTVYLDANTSLLVMPFHDNKASRKNWQTLVGVQYYIPIKIN